jgi:D-alanine-D-alanine ligase
MVKNRFYASVAKIIPSFESGCFLILSKSLAKLKVDVVFPVVHGPMGEDGTLQGLFELMNLAYVGCGVLSSANGMDKAVSKKLVSLEGVPVLKHVLIENSNTINNEKYLDRCMKLGWPLFVKPLSLGSSVGVRKVMTALELKKSIRYAFKYDTRVIVEKGIDRAREIVCGVLGDLTDAKASVCGEVRLKGKHEFFDYDAKYLDSDAFEFDLPAVLPKNLSKSIKTASVKAFKCLNCSGLARVDFLLNPRNQLEFYFCEINTIPGFTSHSLYPKLWEYSGLSISELIDELVNIAIRTHADKMKVSSIL